MRGREIPGLDPIAVTVWAVAADDGMGGVINECDEVDNSLPKPQLCNPTG